MRADFLDAIVRHIAYQDAFFASRRQVNHIDPDAVTGNHFAAGELLDHLSVDLNPLHQQAVDTTTPGGRALFQMMGVFAEFERAMIRDRVKAGLVGCGTDN